MNRFAFLAFLVSFHSLISVQSLVVVNPFPGITISRPVDFQHDGVNQDLVYVVSQYGEIIVFENSIDATPSTFLDLKQKSSCCGESGLLGLAFHPNYTNNGYFYTYRTWTTGGKLQSFVSRFTVTANRLVADAASELILMQFDQPYANHNGGQMRFGPDGYLYIGTGDGGSGGDPQNHGQTLNTFLGKMLRIDVDTTGNGKNYGIPLDNPFRGNNASYFEEIWAYGLRNPWRWSFDSKGRLWAGDVGQGIWEEISVVEKGGNYGWKIMEGRACYPPTVQNCDKTGLILPIFDYRHTGSEPTGQSITGGFVYEGKLAPELDGKYIYADYGSKKIWSLTFDEADLYQNSWQLIAANPWAISAFGVDPENELYFLDYAGGKIYKFNNETLPGETITLVTDTDNSSDGDSTSGTTDLISSLPFGSSTTSTGTILMLGYLLHNLCVFFFLL